MVFANAAILFYLAGRATDLKECYAMAEETYRSGAVRRKVAAIQQLMPKR
jgi:anthranilate phosphoribosyltransferase